MENQEQTEVRKKAFHEICEGEFAQDVQREFEQAQLIASDRGVETSVNIKIHIAPPKKEDPRFSNIAYQVEIKQPAKKSMIFATRLHDGLITSDSKAIGDLNQLNLDFPSVKQQDESPLQGNEN